MLCSYCQAFSPIYQKSNECCQIRLLAESPKHRRLAVYAKIKKESGSAELEELKKAVYKEYVRMQEWKASKSKNMEE